MVRHPSYYKLFVYLCVIYILYALVINLVVHPGAATFLSHKTDLSHELKPQIWLKVMYVHVAFGCLAMASGLVNFVSRNYEKHRKFHRVNGYFYTASVFLVVLSSGYMAPCATGGRVSSVGLNVLSMIWMAVTVIAIVHVRKKRIVQHRRWMVRSYAFCFTNLLIHLFSSVLHQSGVDYVNSYIIGLYGAIAVVLAAPAVIFRVQGKL
ncbi:putative membrane protein DUF2306 [Paenibacillus taihuensis]|uniref:Putative membrane protein DUF2306 n=1 Tax=Paenibacillus taihuensis TaxID=1156355 RepID=A0A3D9S5N8_9BACL|nr:DUF2306 domain-containing protein [Paenibacillus taihuensis]REE83882.1 putative membrane protein DUF2306 [Paenibacillus taihuensis]